MNQCKGFIGFTSLVGVLPKVFGIGEPKTGLHWNRFHVDAGSLTTLRLHMLTLYHIIKQNQRNKGQCEIYLVERDLCYSNFLRYFIQKKGNCDYHSSISDGVGHLWCLSDVLIGYEQTIFLLPRLVCRIFAKLLLQSFCTAI